MLQHTLKTIFRQLYRAPLFTSIHLLGLSAGFCAVLIIFLYIRQELSYDQDCPNVYRVTQIQEQHGELSYSEGSAYVMPAALRTDIPDFAVVSGIHVQGDGVVRLPGQDFLRLEEVIWADEEWLKLFDYEWVTKPDPEVLAQPNKVLLSATTAEQLFGDQAVLGQELDLDGTYNLTVAGVFQDRQQSNLQPEMLVSLITLPEQLHGFDRTDWGLSIGGITYVKLAEGQQPQQFASSLAAFVDKYLNGGDEGVKNTLHLQALSTQHFDTRFEDYTTVPTSSETNLWIAAGIGLLILLMACFNFVNLSLAENLTKRQVVGMQKILGARSQQLWLQGWGQALLLALIGLGLGVLLMQLLLPQVETMLERPLAYHGLSDGSVWGFVLATVGVVSLIAGAYPAYVIARKRPQEVLSNAKLVSNGRQRSIRHGIVLAQFVITLLMICSAVTVSRQLTYLQNKDLGFRQDAIMQIGLPQPGLNETARTTWQRIVGVEAVSFSLGAPTSGNRLGTSYYPKGKDPQQYTEGVDLKPVDEQFADAYELEILAGKFLEATDAYRIDEATEDANPEWPIVINETLLHELGYAEAEAAIGEYIVLGVNNADCLIKGVVADFHTHSLRESVAPLIMTPLGNLYYEVGLKIAPDKVSDVLAQVEASYLTLFPDQYFDYQFLDQAMADQYIQEDRINSLLQGLAGLAIIIACLGLFGLTAIMVQQRRREIGLRKVLGASVASIWGLLSKDMLRLIAIALLIAGPLAWYAMQQWLAGFAFSVDLNVWSFVLGGLLLVGIALLTVSGLAIRAALSNPINALRNE